MVNLDQVKLLDSKVTDIINKAIRLEENNNALLQQNEELKSKLDTNQKRIDDLETLIVRFREDQGRIEESILATLEKINQFGEVISNKLNKKTSGSKAAKKSASEPLAQEQSAQEPIVQEPEQPESNEGDEDSVFEDDSAGDDSVGDTDSIDEKVCFEIPKSDTPWNEETMDDIPDPLDEEEELSDNSDMPASDDDGELDIF